MINKVLLIKTKTPILHMLRNWLIYTSILMTAVFQTAYSNNVSLTLNKTKEGI